MEWRKKEKGIDNEDVDDCIFKLSLIDHSAESLKLIIRGF